MRPLLSVDLFVKPFIGKVMMSGKVVVSLVGRKRVCLGPGITESVESIIGVGESFR